MDCVEQRCRKVPSLQLITKAAMLFFVTIVEFDDLVDFGIGDIMTEIHATIPVSPDRLLEVSSIVVARWRGKVPHPLRANCERT